MDAARAGGRGDAGRPSPDRRDRRDPTLGYAVGGHIAQAEAAYAETAALVAAMRDAELGDRSDALAYLCSVGTFLDRYDEACAHGERALRLGRSAGHLHPTLLPALGAAHLLRGRLGDAANVLDAGLEAARLAGITQSMAWMLRNRALLAVAVGDARARSRWPRRRWSSRGAGRERAVRVGGADRRLGRRRRR